MYFDYYTYIKNVQRDNVINVIKKNERFLIMQKCELNKFIN